MFWIWASELDLDLSLEFTPGGFIFLNGLVSSFVGLPIPNYWTTIYLKYFPYWTIYMSSPHMTESQIRPSFCLMYPFLILPILCCMVTH
jgi:hypothetical protein